MVLLHPERAETLNRAVFLLNLLPLQKTALTGVLEKAIVLPDASRDIFGTSKMELGSLDSRALPLEGH